MDPCYRNTHLKFLGTCFLSFLGNLVWIKRVCSYSFLVSFFQLGELSLSLGLLGPCYTLEIMISPTLNFLEEGH